MLISRVYWFVMTQWVYRQSLGTLGRGSRIIKPLELRKMRHIHVGANVMIGAHAWLWAFPATECLEPKMVIADGCKIGHFNHIACVNSVELGPKCSRPTVFTSPIMGMPSRMFLWRSWISLLRLGVLWLSGQALGWGKTFRFFFLPDRSKLRRRNQCRRHKGYTRFLRRRRCSGPRHPPLRPEFPAVGAGLNRNP